MLLVAGMICALGVGLAAVENRPGLGLAVDLYQRTDLFLTSTNSIRMIGADGSDSVISSGQATLPNSIAFDPVDGNLYMLTANNNVLRIVQADGTVTTLGAVTGLPNVNYFAATFAPDGTLWLTSATANLWRVDVHALTATSLPTSTTVTGDLVWVKGPCTPQKGSRSPGIDVTTGQVTTTSNVPNFSGLGTTGLWYIGGHFLRQQRTHSV